MKDRKWKVLLLDDEAYMLDMLKMMIQWDFYGFELVGAACSAGEAMSLYYEKHPDIIITDICMDGVNGIEFLNKVRLQDARVKFIILSAYDRFEYAQKALKLNVDGYLLKPVSTEELLNQLLEIQKKLEQDEDYAVQLQNLRKSLGELEEKYRHSQLLTVWQKNESVSGALAEDKSAWMVLSLRTIVRDEIVFIERELKREASLSVDVIFADDGEFGIFLNSDTEKELRNAVALIRQKYCDEEKSVLCGVSRLEYGTKDLAELCQESREALNQLFYEENRYYLRYHQKNGKQEKLTDPEESQFLLWMVNGEEEKWRKGLNELTDFLRCQNVSRRQAVDKFIEIKNTAVQLASDQKQLDKLDKIQQEMERVYRAAELKNLAARCAEIVNADSIKGKKNRMLVLNAREYIKENYFEESFSMDSLAEYLKISKSYLSKVYKEETGESVWTYVIRLRIAKAKEMLASTDATGYAIARAIGYTSEYHFSRAFTKEVGMSPSAYKKLYMKIK